MSNVLWGFPFSKVLKRSTFICMAKEKKKRADKYDTKLAINGSFEDVIKVMVTPTPAPPKEIKSVKKKK
jgi:hypothetical protein